MITVFIEKENYNDYIYIKDKADINHLKNVLRVRVGDEIRAVDGEKEYLCNVAEISSKDIKLNILNINTANEEDTVIVDAAVSLIKNDKMDIAIQKLTEIGIDNFIPVVSRRCVVKLDKKKEKWDKIVKETMKQCKGLKSMAVKELVNLEDLSFEEYDLIIVPYEMENQFSLKSLLDKAEEDIKKVLYIVGPEGGFEKNEIEFLVSKGSKIVTLGKRILRAETASIVVGGILTNEFK